MRRTLFALLALVTLIAGFVAGCATGSGQPHMTAARDHLRAAKGQLESAVADKGGHRGRAIAIVNDAITEVEAGMEFANTH
jgi:hypothetical protein